MVERAVTFSLPFLRPRQRDWRIPVLTYHALHAPGLDYMSNDHIALEEDLRVIRRSGFRVADVKAIAASVHRRKSPFASGKWVGLTFDDGTDFDFIDLAHPHLGLIKSFCTILREAAGPNGDRWPKPTGVSFVIASPEARKVLDRTCIAGLGQWRDTWWRDAARSGILAIGNHSWDHTHETLETVAQREQRKGTFYGIDNFEDADRQIRGAQEYINGRTDGLSTRLFAYPYGEASDYLVQEYFPRYKSAHKIVAAFGLTGDYVTAQSNRWNLPRFSCGADWKSPAELERILHDAVA